MTEWPQTTLPDPVDTAAATIRAEKELASQVYRSQSKVLEAPSGDGASGKAVAWKRQGNLLATTEHGHSRALQDLDSAA